MDEAPQPESASPAAAGPVASDAPATTEGQSLVPTTGAESVSPTWIPWAGGGLLALLLLGVGLWTLRGRAAISGATAPALTTSAPAQRAPASGLVAALARSREALQDGLKRLFSGPVNEEGLEALEESLLQADVGMPTTERLVGAVRAKLKAGEVAPEALRAALSAEMRAILLSVAEPLTPKPGLWVILVVGVNGSGKTTTIGKLAAQLGQSGRKVLLAAGDTFRAAAGEQLEVWAERAGAQIVRHQEGADPGAVVWDALEAAEARGMDVVIIDTAGRLQTRKPLMEQLGKVRRVIQKRVPDGPHETLLVIDGTMGQNALSQARLFHEVTPLTGVVVTKLDGTAKGGVLLAVADELKLPVKLVGVGEKVGDLQAFDPEAYVSALS